MRAFSGVASITIHVGLGAAVLLGPAKTGRSNPRSSEPVSIVFPQPAARTTTSETRFVSFRRLIPSLLRLRDRRSSPRCFGQHLFPDERCACECEFPTTSRSETARDVPVEIDVKGSSGCHRFVIFRLLAGQVQRVLLVSEPVHQPGGYGGV